MATKKKTSKTAKPVAAKAAETPVEATKVRRLKKAETVREKADKASNAKPKKRVLRNTAGTAAKPFKAIGRFFAKVFRPFRFLLWPFRTRPVRLLGRFLAAILFLKYIRNSAREVRTVSWPDRRQTFRLTFAVFMFAIVFGAVISLVDYGLDKVFKQLLLK